MYNIHHRLIRNKWLHGIEFFNHKEYYPLVMTFALENNLAVFANSDMHGAISEEYAGKTHRPMTLVFARERSHDSLKEAMFAGRTLAYFDDMLAGRKEYALPFFHQCISVGKPYYQNEKSIYLEITNRSDIPFYLTDGVPGTPSSITLPANSATRVVLSKSNTNPLIYNVRNIITGESEVLKVELKY
jgi:hypothetical protein